MKKVSVVILDDSLFVREAMQQELERDVNIKVVGKACDAYEARDMIVEYMPDMLIVDVNLGKISGTEFVRMLLPQYYLPVIMISSDPSQKEIALSIHAVDFICKPLKGDSQEIDAFYKNVIASIKSVANGDSTQLPIKPLMTTAIAIGASTGGAEAIESLLKDLPSMMPPLVVVQHMPANFTKSFAERVNQHCALSVKEAEDGDVLIPGQAYIAPGGQDTLIKGRAGRYYLSVQPPVNPKKPTPNIDVMFHSVAETYGANAIGVLLTGMGKDGAQGLQAMHDKGAVTFGQDEESCVVYGMPRVAYEMGAVDYQCAPKEIGKKCVEMVKAFKKTGERAVESKR